MTADNLPFDPRHRARAIDHDARPRDLSEGQFRELARVREFLVTTDRIGWMGSDGQVRSVSRWRNGNRRENLAFAEAARMESEARIDKSLLERRAAVTAGQRDLFL